MYKRQSSDSAVKELVNHGILHLGHFNFVVMCKYGSIQIYKTTNTNKYFLNTTHI